MLVRACHKCKTYIDIVETYDGQQFVRQFEKDHRGHPLSTLNIEDLPQYVEEKLQANSSKK